MSDVKLLPARVKPRRIGLISSTPGYNLGLAKLASWARKMGWEVEMLTEVNPFDGLLYDVIAISVIFSWDLPRAIQWGQFAKVLWMGGPAVSANAHYVQQQLPHAQISIGADDRFERETGDFKWTRWGRGCAVGCWFCIVPKIDGKTAIEYPDSHPARVIVDDNILRYSWQHQERIVEQTLASGLKRIDINSGFDPAVFEQKHFDLYKKLDLQYWRTAYDTLQEGQQVKQMLTILRENKVSSRQIPVYMLAGAEPFEQSMERARQIVTWGGEPRIQMFKPLNWLKTRQEAWVHPKWNWTRRQVINFPRYWYSYKWRSETWDTWLERQAA